MGQLIGTSMRTLAMIADNKPGHEVTEEKGFVFRNIRFDRTASGRRNKRIVLADYTDPTGKTFSGTFDADLRITYHG